jgi:hypothetical protein
MQDVLRKVHGEICDTGGLRVGSEPVTMRAKRVQPTGHWLHPREIPGVVPAWHVIGPFDDADKKMLAAVFGPEEGVDLQDVCEGKSGPVRWIRRLSHGGVLGLIELFGDQAYTANAVAYAYSTVSSPHEQTVQIRFGSDDDAIVWLNGKVIWRHEGSRGIGRDDDVIEAALPAGESQILVKVYNRGGMWAMFMRFTDLSGKGLDGLRFSPTGR